MRRSRWVCCLQGEGRASLTARGAVVRLRVAMGRRMSSTHLRPFWAAAAWVSSQLLVLRAFVRLAEVRLEAKSCGLLQRATEVGRSDGFRDRRSEGRACANCGEDGEGCGRLFVYTGEEAE